MPHPVFDKEILKELPAALGGQRFDCVESMDCVNVVDAMLDQILATAKTYDEAGSCVPIEAGTIVWFALIARRYRELCALALEHGLEGELPDEIKGDAEFMKWFKEERRN